MYKMPKWTSINSLQMSFNQLLYPAVNCKRLFSKTRNSAVFTNIGLWYSSPYKSHTRCNLLKAPILSYETYVHSLKGTLIYFKLWPIVQSYQSIPPSTRKIQKQEFPFFVCSWPIPKLKSPFSSCSTSLLKRYLKQ